VGRRKIVFWGIDIEKTQLRKKRKRPVGLVFERRGGVSLVSRQCFDEAKQAIETKGIIRGLV